jgi:hypothetical protein
MYTYILYIYRKGLRGDAAVCGALVDSIRADAEELEVSLNRALIEP